MRTVSKPFYSLNLDQLYDLLALRSKIFVVEQQAVYLDCDGRDKQAIHVLIYSDSGQLAAAARVLPPGTLFEEPAVGRVVVDPEWRGKSLGHELMRTALNVCAQSFKNQPVRISAQQHLRKFYSQHGFEVISEPYLEDGIWHVAMLRT